MTRLRIGIDLGGTKIEAIALLSGQGFLSRMRVDTPDWNYQHTLEKIAELVTTIEKQHNMKSRVGIGIPGVPAPETGLIKNANSTYLIGRPFATDLEDRLHRPVRLANDANCFALSEALDGAGRTADTVFGVILGTGVGGGLIVNRKIHEGRNRIAGEWGHNPLPWPISEAERESTCYCGKCGCIESLLCGPALERQYRDATGRTCRATDIATRADSGDTSAVKVMDIYEDRLARALSSVINIVDPDRIILGGGLSRMTRLYHTLPGLIGKYVFSDTVTTPVLPPEHGDSSGVRGAALLWNDG